MKAIICEPAAKPVWKARDAEAFGIPLDCIRRATHPSDHRILSYRHGFHAGNHADVLKHLVLMQLLKHLTRKDNALWVIDTHAGAGGYSLQAGYATRNAEFADGIGRLWSRRNFPAPLRD